MVDEVDPFLPEADDLADKQVAAAKDKDSDEFRNYVERLRASYVRVFVAGTPSKEDREAVLNDLEIFTRGERTPWHENERVHCVLVGRHEVFTRIKHHTGLSLDGLVVEKLAPKS
jgi:hypothetical protein